MSGERGQGEREEEVSPERTLNFARPDLPGEDLAETLSPAGEGERGVSPERTLNLARPDLPSEVPAESLSPERTLNLERPDLPGEDLTRTRSPGGAGDPEDLAATVGPGQSAPGAPGSFSPYAETIKQEPTWVGADTSEEAAQGYGDLKDVGAGDYAKTNPPPDESRTLGPDSEAPTESPLEFGSDPGGRGRRPSGSEGAGSKDVGAKAGSSGARLRSADSEGSNKLAPGELYAGKYELLHEIARGGMGVVFKARQVDLNRLVALKVMLSGSYAREDERRRFILEAEASAKLKHPNIVPVFDIGEVDGNLYFTMDFVEGAPLSRRADALGRDELREVMIKVCSGVAYAHQRGIIHRDLKPGNIMMSDDEPLIMDFGLAKQLELTDEEGQPDRRTQDGVVMGTPHYMPPEQAEGQVSEIDVRSDVWALGVILYELFCKTLPFTGSGLSELMLRIFDEDPVRPRQHDPSLDPDIEAIILKALEKQKDQRYDSAAALQRDLERWRDGLPISARRATPLYRFGKWARRHRGGLAVALVFALVVSGLGGFGVHQYREGVRQRELAEREQREAQLAAYRQELGSLAQRQQELLERAQEQRAAVAALFSSSAGWEQRAQEREPVAERLVAARAELAGAGAGLARYAGLEEGVDQLGAEERRALQQDRARQAALAEARQAELARLSEQEQRLASLAEAHAQLSAGQALREQAAERREAAIQALTQGDAAAGERPWSGGLEAALAYYQAHPIPRAGELARQEDPARQRFERSADELTQTAFRALAAAEGGSPERDQGRELLEQLQGLRMDVERAQTNAARGRLAQRLDREALALLEALEARRGAELPPAGEARAAEQELRLRAARLAQTLVQRGREASEELSQLATLQRANRLYAEVLLDLQAWTIFDVEVANANLSDEDRAALRAQRAEATRRRAALVARIEELGQGLGELSVAALDERQRSLALVDVGSDAELKQQRAEVAGRLAEARRERARQDVDGQLGQLAARSAALSPAERRAQLESLVEEWRAVASLAASYAEAEALPAARAEGVARRCQREVGALYREAALAVRASDARAARALVAKARAALRVAGADAEVLGELDELDASLARASEIPEGMILILGAKQALLGGGPGDNNPPREVSVAPFYLAVHEVTNREWAAAVREGQVPAPPHWVGGQPPPGGEELPVVGVTFAEAQAFAAAKGLRLPRDREWELAARLGEQQRLRRGRVYPWGEVWSGDALRRTLRPSGSNRRDVSAAGVFDLAGNVSEWVVLAEGEAAARGASFLYPIARLAACGHRLRPAPDYRGPQLGLRLAKSAPTGEKR